MTTVQDIEKAKAAIQARNVLGEIAAGPALDWNLEKLGEYVRDRAKKSAVYAWEMGKALSLVKLKAKRKFQAWCKVRPLLFDPDDSAIHPGCATGEARHPGVWTVPSIRTA